MDDDDDVVTLTQLRRYAGEVYSMAWDAALGLDERESGGAGGESHGSGDGDDQRDDGGNVLAGPITSGGTLLDLIVYPQNMPNTPPEGWIANRPDLTCICSHDSITGWVTDDEYAGGKGKRFAGREGEGKGGLDAHVRAVNAERERKGLGTVVALHVDDWPDGAEVTGDPNVVFLEDEDAFEKVARKQRYGNSDSFGDDEDDLDVNDNNQGNDSKLTSDVRRRQTSQTKLSTAGLMGGTPIPPSSLYTSVAVGGTFDGMHYGHRKLLTLAISSVQPINGRLLIGVTKDEMLTHKAFADRIPPLRQRINGVLDFIGNLAPGMKNRVRCVPIEDEYGPPGQAVDSNAYPGLKNDFDALVLSHETLPTGRKLNRYRVEVLGLEPLKLLCTQRTEPHGMSSTALRRMRR